MKKFSDTIELTHKADAVLQTATNPSYLKQRYSKVDHLITFDLEPVQDDEAGFECLIRREFGIGDGVPRVIRKIVGESLVLEQQHQWDRQGPPYTGSLHIEAAGFPGEISAGLLLQDRGDSGSLIEVDGNISAGIPIVGGQIEKFLMGHVQKVIKDSFQSLNDYIKGQKS